MANKTQPSYLSYQENYPLQLTGNMRRKQTLIPQQPESLPQSSLQILRKKCQRHKIANPKSVLPQEDNRNKLKSSSIRIDYNQESASSSGVTYLMGKSDKEIKGKKHFKETDRPSYTQQYNSKSRKHFTADSCRGDLEQRQSKCKHERTAALRINRDIHSDPTRQEVPKTECVKLEPYNLFREGVTIGLEEMRTKKLSERKMHELMGMEYMREQKAPRGRNLDWCISSITFC